ncbi:MAG: hypothetical protein QOD92_3689 [Acidimicrobiaceae bacterium]|jgi:hypothetical protein
MRNPGQDADQQKHKTRRHEREDLVEHYRDLQREVNSLRPGYKGQPLSDIATMLERRFGKDLDAGTLDRCAHAFAAGESIEISAPAPQRSPDSRRRG